MAESTNIAWTRSTHNDWIGCTKIGPGCDHCYASVSMPARTLDIEWGPGKPRHRTGAANRKMPLLWNEQARREREAGVLWAGRPGFWPVFCGSLCDVFDNEVPDEWRADLMSLIEKTPNLTWLLLTKRIGNAERLIEEAGDFIDCGEGWRSMWGQGVWPNNVWLGATVVNQEEADRDIPKLLAVPAAKHFVSYEPALEQVDFGLQCENWSDEIVMDPDTGAYDCCRKCDYTGIGNDIDWIIVGGESGPGARQFDIEWARDTVRQCRQAGVPVFVKQLGSNPAPLHVEANSVRERLWLKDRAGADPAEWPEDLRVQEFPR